jgi:hypothetical protein
MQKKTNVWSKGETIMATKKKGILTLWPEYERHLKPHGRRKFWSKERMAVSKSIRAELLSEMFDFDGDTSDSAINQEKPKNLWRSQST